MESVVRTKVMLSLLILQPSPTRIHPKEKRHATMEMKSVPKKEPPSPNKVICIYKQSCLLYQCVANAHNYLATVSLTPFKTLCYSKGFTIVFSKRISSRLLLPLLVKVRTANAKAKLYKVMKLLQVHNRMTRQVLAMENQVHRHVVVMIVQPIPPTKQSLM
jgi:hypothetical protein